MRKRYMKCGWRLASPRLAILGVSFLFILTALSYVPENVTAVQHTMLTLTPWHDEGTVADASDGFPFEGYWHRAWRYEHSEEIANPTHYSCPQIGMSFLIDRYTTYDDNECDNGPEWGFPESFYSNCKYMTWDFPFCTYIDTEWWMPNEYCTFHGKNCTEAASGEKVYHIADKYNPENDAGYVTPLGSASIQAWDYTYLGHEPSPSVELKFPLQRIPTPMKDTSLPDRIELTWSSLYDPFGDSFTGFRIYRSTSNQASHKDNWTDSTGNGNPVAVDTAWTVAGNTTSTSFTDVNITGGVEYFYKISVLYTGKQWKCTHYDAQGVCDQTTLSNDPETWVESMYKSSSSLPIIKTPPTITITNPSAAGASADTSYLLTWVDEDPDSDASISLYYDSDRSGRDGTLIASGILEGDETDAYLWDVSALPDDSTWYVYAKIDDSWNYPVYDYSIGILTVDHPNVLPGVSIGLPSGGTVTGTVSISGTASDTDGDVAQVQVMIDSGEWKIGQGTTTWSYSWDTSEVSNDYHYIHARSYDGEDYSATDTVTVLVDNRDYSPPVITMGPDVTTITGSTATITWITDEAANSTVEYGETAAYGMRAEDLSYSLPHTITLVGLLSATDYHYKVISYDARGNGPTISLDLTFETTSITDTTPPVITEGPQVTSLSETSATIAWGTDESSDSVIEYGTSTSYGTLKTDSGHVLSHTLTLTGLAPFTEYHYVVSSTDASENGPTKSADFTFTTGKDDTTPPDIIGSPTVSSISNTSVYITWATDEYSDSVVEYGLSDFSSLSSNRDFVTYHWIILTGLSPSSTYLYRASSTDTRGNGPTVSDNFTFTTDTALDMTPPVITGPHVSYTSSVSAKVTWFTDEPANGFVEYGTTSAYGLAESISTYGTYRELLIQGLIPGTTYHFRVRSTDLSNNIATSSDWTFTTDSNADTEPPVINYVSPFDKSIISKLTTISVAATDNVGLARAEFYLNDELTHVDSTYPYAWHWNTTFFEDAFHIVKIIVYDNTENTAEKILSLLLDNPDIPTVVINIPGSDKVRGTTVITGAAFDSDIEDTIAHVDVRIGTGLWILANGTSDWSYTWITDDLPDGNYTIYARAYDGSDYSTIDNITLEVSNANFLPSVVISSSFDGTVSGIISISGVASDPDGVIQLVELKIDNGTWNTISLEGNWSLEINSASLSEGQHELSIRAYDGEAYSEVQILTIDVEHPVIKESPIDPPFDFVPWIYILALVFSLLGGIAIGRFRKENAPSAPKGPPLPPTGPGASAQDSAHTPFKRPIDQTPQKPPRFNTVQTVQCPLCRSFFNAEMNSGVVCPHCGASGRSGNHGPRRGS